MSVAERYPNVDEYKAGSLEPWTCELLCLLIELLEPQVVLETGSFEGRTTMKMLEILGRGRAGARLNTVENDLVRFDAIAGREWPPTKAGVQLGFHFGDALEYLRQQPNESVDFIFLDDDHTADHVAQEVHEVMRVLRPGGVCAVHDVTGPFHLKPVVLAVGGVCLPLIRLHAAGGIGLICK